MTAVEVLAAAFAAQDVHPPFAYASVAISALKAAGYAVVELPKPDTPHPSWTGDWFGGEPESVYPETKYPVFDPGGDVIISGVMRLTRVGARSLAAALFAAADAAEDHS